MQNKKVHKHPKNKSMDKVKIKRVKRQKKNYTTKEKIVAGLGLGSTLLGGVGAVSAKPSQTQFVRTAESEKASQTSKNKNRLNSVFGRFFGVNKAKADFTPNATALLPNNPTGSQSLPYEVSTDGSGQTTITVANGQSVSYSNPQELLNILSQANANPGSVDPDLVTALTNNYYGSVYNNSPSVTAAYAPTSPGNILYSELHPGEPNPNNMPNPWQIAGAQAILNSQNQIAGSIVHIGGNSATDQIGVWIADPTGNSAGTTRIFGSDTEANAFLRQQGLTANYSSQTNTTAPVVQTNNNIPSGETGNNQAYLVNNLTSIYDENNNITAIQAEYQGQRYAIVANGDGTFRVYDGNGQLTTALPSDLINQIAATNPQYAIITDAEGNPISVWDQLGNDITQTTAGSQVLSAYHTGRAQLNAQAVNNNSVTNVAVNTTITNQQVQSAIAENNSGFLQNLLNGTGMDINARLASDPQLAQQLYDYMISHNMSQGYTQGSLGAIIMGMARTTTSNTITPGSGVQQTWSNEGLTQAYNNAIHPYSLTTTTTPSGQTIYSVTVNTSNGRVTSPSMSAAEINRWLTERWSTSDAFLSLNPNDQAIFAAFVQAGLANPSFLANSNLPRPNTSVTETITYVDGNGQLTTVTQPWGVGLLLTRQQAETLRSMFPGATLSVMPIPESPDYHLNLNGETRQRYELNIPGQGGYSAGLLWQQFVQYGASGIFGINNIPGFNPSAASTVLPTGTPVSGPVAYNSGSLSGAPGAVAATPVINTTSLPAGNVGVVYNQNLLSSNFSSGVTWSAVGDVPPGLTLSTNGVISGTPLRAGSFIFLVTATGGGKSANQVLTLVINGQQNVTPPAGGTTTGVITTTVLPSVMVNSQYPAITLSATGMGSSVNWTAAGLPSGLTLSSAGVLSGRPTQSGSFNVAVTARGTSTATKSFTLVVNPQATTGAIINLVSLSVNNNQISSPSVADINAGKVKVNVSGQNFTGTTIAASFTKGTQVFTVNPAAITRSGTAFSFTMPSGTAQNQWSSGNYVLTIRLTNSSGQTVTRTSNITVGSTTRRPESVDTLAQTDLNIQNSFTSITNLPDYIDNTANLQTQNLPAQITANRHELNLNSQTYVIPSVSNVADDNEAAEENELAGQNTVISRPSVSQVADDDSVEYDESKNSHISNFSNNTGSVTYVTDLGNDQEVEVDEVGSLQNNAVALNDEEVEVEEVATGANQNLGLGNGVTASFTQNQAGLQNQIISLQSKVNELNQKIAAQSASGGSTVVIQSDQALVRNLQNQIGRLTAQLNSLQQNQITTFNRQTSSLLKYPGSGEAGSYTVKKGDTLWGISKKYYGNGIYWRKILEANLDKVKNPRTMRIGITLTIPELTDAEKAKSNKNSVTPVNNTQGGNIQTFQRDTSQTAQVNTVAEVKDTQAVSPRGKVSNNPDQNASYMNKNLNSSQGVIFRPSVSDVASDEEVEVIKE